MSGSYLLAHKKGKKIHVFAVGAYKFYGAGGDWDTGRTSEILCPICKETCIPYALGTVLDALIKNMPSDEVGVPVVY